MTNHGKYTYVVTGGGEYPLYVGPELPVAIWIYDRMHGEAVHRFNGSQVWRMAGGRVTRESGGHGDQWQVVNRGLAARVAKLEESPDEVAEVPEKGQGEPDDDGESPFGTEAERRTQKTLLRIEMAVSGIHYILHSRG